MRDRANRYRSYIARVRCAITSLTPGARFQAGSRCSPGVHRPGNRVSPCCCTLLPMPITCCSLLRLIARRSGAEVQLHFEVIRYGRQPVPPRRRLKPQLSREDSGGVRNPTPSRSSVMPSMAASFQSFRGKCAESVSGLLMGVRPGIARSCAEGTLRPTKY